jgi:hypothetical protein
MYTENSIIMYFGNAQYDGGANEGVFANMWGDAMQKQANFASSMLGMIAVHVAVAILIVLVVVFFVSITKTEGFSLSGRGAYQDSLSNPSDAQTMDHAYAAGTGNPESRPGASISGMLNRHRRSQRMSQRRREAMTSESELQKRL